MNFSEDNSFPTIKLFDNFDPEKLPLQGNRGKIR